MRKLSLLASLVMLSAAVSAQNPIIRNQFSADPTARVFNGKIYLFPSHDTTPASIPDFPRKDWFCMNDYHVFSSENLTEWTDHGKIIDQKDVPWGNPKGYSMWAPDCVQGKDGKYYFYFPDGQKQGFGFGIGVAVADKPEGPYTVLEKNIEGINGIDPCVLQASDGNNYIFWGAGNCAKLKDNMIELADDNPTDTIKWGPRQFVMRGVSCLRGLPSRQAEGPFAFEYNGNYYLTYPYVVERTEALGYAMSKNPMGPYEYKGLIMEERPECWTNHHSIVNYKGQWYLFYHHNDYSPNFDKNRSVFADSLFFNEDGTIRPVKSTLRGIGVTKASDKIQIDRYTSIGGDASISFLYENDPDTTKRFEGWKTTFSKPGSWVKYNTVDFGKGNGKQLILALTEGGSGTITVKVDGANGPVLAEVKVEASAKTASAQIENCPKGIHHVYVELTEGENVNIDWITVEGSSSNLVWILLAAAALIVIIVVVAKSKSCKCKK